MNEHEEKRGLLGLDTRVPSSARVYDFWLGGKDNFAADREQALQMEGVYRPIRTLVWDNRRFLKRAVYWAACQGVRQFLDLGSGLPTAENTHEVARAAAPDARVVYVDNDPVAVTHASALLADGRGVRVVGADLADPGTVLAHPVVNQVVDLSQPVVVVLAMVLHFFPAGQAARIVAAYARAAAPGSFLIVSCGSGDEYLGPALVKTYRARPLYNHSPAQILSWLDGLDVQDPPGLVDAQHWAPGKAAEPPAPAGGHVLAAVAQVPLLAGANEEGAVRLAGRESDPPLPVRVRAVGAAPAPASGRPVLTLVAPGGRRCL